MPHLLTGVGLVAGLAKTGSSDRGTRQAILNYIKQHDLNPLQRSFKSRKDSDKYIEWLVTAISGLNYGNVSELFLTRIGLFVHLFLLLSVVFHSFSQKY